MDKALKDNLTVLTLSVIALALVVQTVLQIADLGSSAPETTAQSPQPKQQRQRQPQQQPPQQQPPQIQTQPQQQQQANQTQVELPATQHNFGTVSPGDDAQHEFEVKNTGDKPLNLSRVRAGTGLKIVDYSKEPVPPGGSAKVVVGINTAQAQPGQMQEVVHVDLNAPEQHIHLNVGANVQK